jgi:glutamate-1-semialdehyde 2,1-aminomutase
MLVSFLSLFSDPISSAMQSAGVLDGPNRDGVLESGQPMLSNLCNGLLTNIVTEGGGMSFGAFGGKREIMELFDPRKPNHLQHAGTFNNNVLTMAAGRAGLEQIFTPARARQLHTRGDKLRTSLQEASLGTLMKVTGLGSLMCFHFIDTPAEKIRSPDDTADEDKTLAAIFHLYLLEQGYYTSRRGYIALSLALGERELTGFYEAVVGFLRRYKSLLVPQSANSKI